MGQSGKQSRDDFQGCTKNGRFKLKIHCRRNLKSELSVCSKGD